MFSIDNAKAFKVSKALREKWEAMTDRNDHAGVILEKVGFVRKGLEKIKSPLVGEAKRLEGLCREVVDEREKEGGLSYEKCTLDDAYLKMAGALVTTEVFDEDVANEILNA